MRQITNTNELKIGDKIEVFCIALNRTLLTGVVTSLTDKKINIKLPIKHSIGTTGRTSDKYSFYHKTALIQNKIFIN